MLSTDLRDEKRDQRTYNLALYCSTGISRTLYAPLKSFPFTKSKLGTFPGQLAAVDRHKIVRKCSQNSQNRTICTQLTAILVKMQFTHFSLTQENVRIVHIKFTIQFE